MNVRRRIGCLAVAILLFAPAFWPGVAAQSGELRSGTVVLTYPSGRRQQAIPFLEAIPSARAVIRSRTGLDVPAGTRLELVPDADALNRRCREETGEGIPRWVGGISVNGRQLVIIRLDLRGPRWERVEGIVVHELCHVAVDTLRAKEGAAEVPRWLDEGIAQVVEGRPYVDDTPHLGLRAFLGQHIQFYELEHAFPATEGASALAYAQSESFVRFIEKRALGTDVAGRGGIRLVLSEIADGGSVDEAIRVATGLGVESLEAQWRSGLDQDRTWIMDLSVKVGFSVFLAIITVMGIRRVVWRKRFWERRWQEDDRPRGLPPGDDADQETSTSSSR